MTYGNQADLTGRTFELPTAEGVKTPTQPYVIEVLRPHRDVGYWECKYVSGGHSARHGSLCVISTAEIKNRLAA